MQNKCVFIFVYEKYSVYLYYNKTQKLYAMKTKRTAKDLKVGDDFRKDGNLFTVAKIRKCEYYNGKRVAVIDCYVNNSKTIDSRSGFVFKLDTEI